MVRNFLLKSEEYAVLYSFKQKIIDIEPLKKVLKLNLKEIETEIEEENKDDYKILFVGNFNECFNFICKTFRNKMHLLRNFDCYLWVEK